MPIILRLGLVNIDQKVFCSTGAKQDPNLNLSHMRIAFFGHKSFDPLELKKSKLNTH